jgi:spore germination cell wall hydrolase CwlJ-like protein
MGVVAPWCLGMGLVVSFTADAGQDASIGASLAPLSARAPAARVAVLFGGRAALIPFIANASLEVGDLTPRGESEDELQPRRSLKHNARAWPTPDRSHKGDPAVGLRPTFDAKLRQRGGLQAARAGELMLGSDDYMAFDGFAPNAGPAPGPDSVASFEPPVNAGAPGASPSSEATPSPAQSGSSPTLLSVGRQSPGVFDGSTPAVPRAVALGSTTPAGADQTPVEVVALSGVPHAAQIAPQKIAPNATIVERNADRPNYASLVDQGRGAAEEKCLAEAVYFEARSEPEAGQAAVAQVVLNRVQSGLYPPSICGVVYQNRHRHNACQFSFACEGKSLRVTEGDAWKNATRIAHEVLQGETYLADVGGSTHYHANYVKPRWARALKKMDVIGHHIFYTLRPGQT